MEAVPEAQRPTHAFGTIPLAYLTVLERLRVLGIPAGINMSLLVEPAKAWSRYLQEPSAYKLGLALTARSIMQQQSTATQIDIHAAVLAIETLWKPEFDRHAHFPTPRELVDLLLCVPEERWRSACGKFARIATQGPPSIDLMTYCRTMGEKLNPLAVRCWLLGQLDTFARVCNATQAVEQGARLEDFVDALLGKAALL